MVPLPEWAPSLHPIIVHFPVALVVSAFVVDLASVLMRGRGMGLAAWLYAAGALTLGAAFLSGRAGVDDVIVPAYAESVLTDHENWALRTLIYVAILAVVRLGVWRVRRLRSQVVSVILLLFGLGGVGLLAVTADLGGRLVYGLGIGVSETAWNPDGIDEAIPVSGDLKGDLSEGFAWSPGPGAAVTLSEQFVDYQTGLSGSVVDAGQDSLLILRVDGGPVVGVTQAAFGSVQVQYELNLDHFDGVFMILYGAGSSDSYDFVSVETGRMKQGRLSGQQMQEFDDELIDLAGWSTISAVSDNDHFRGYVGGRLTVHGHGAPTPIGGVGFRLEGSGVALIRSMQVTPIR